MSTRSLVLEKGRLSVKARLLRTVRDFGINIDLSCKFHDPKKMNLSLFHNCVIAAFVVVSLSFSAQAGEKKKVTGTDKSGPTISKTVVSPGDDPKHELVTLEIVRATTTSSDPDINGSEVITYEQSDSVAGTGTHRGFFRRLYKNGDTDFGSYEGTIKTTFKEDGSWKETTWEGTWKTTGGTGKFKNSKGSGTYRGKVTAEGAITEWEGEDEY
jgi:hypothetical protein